MSATTVLHACALAAYIAAAVGYAAAGLAKSSRYAVWARVMLIAGIALHTAAIGGYCTTLRASPFADSFGTLSVESWLVAILTLVVEITTRLVAICALASPLAAAVLFAALARAGQPGHAGRQLQGAIVSIHVFMVLISFGLFALSACCAVFYLWQYAALKHPNARAVFRRLPPLDTLDTVAYHMVAFAVPLLTLGIVLGFERAASLRTAAALLADPKILGSLAALLIYSGYLAGRTFAGWRGTRLQYMLISGSLVSALFFFLPGATHRFS